jgi:Fe-S-cluster containining protein
MEPTLRNRIPTAALKRFIDAEPEIDEATLLRRRWQSLVCMSCAACCHSSLIPIAEEDFDAFAHRIGVERESLARWFLADPDTVAPHYTIETVRHGGRCLFLEKKEGIYACAEWDRRPAVCSDFQCWPMEAFARYTADEEQDMFDPATPWEKNLAILFAKVNDEMSGALFDDDMFFYIKSQKSRGFVSRFYKDDPVDEW